MSYSEVLYEIRYVKNFDFLYSDNTPYEKIGNEVRSLADEVPFDIPDSWEWVRLGNISSYAEAKQKINATSADPSIWGLDLEDIEKGGRLLEHKTVGERKAVGDKTVFSKGDILYSKLRPYLLKILVAPDDGICTPEIVPFRIYGGINPNYIVNYLKSPYVDNLINSITYGVKMPRVGTETMISLLVPIPPLEEQQRIVSKIDAVTSAVSAYDTAYRRIENLNLSFSEALKKSILQETVQGKLVPQDPSDEPASVLLERIRAEKEKLVKEGKVKKDKHESVIFRRDNSHYEKRGSEEVCIDEEIPFEIPENWVWCRFEAATLYVTDYVANGSFASLRENVKTYKEENYALMVKTQDFSNDFSRGLTYTDQKGFDYLQKSRLYGGELMLSNIGASIGKAFVIPTMNIRMTLAPNAIVVKCLDVVMTEHLRYFILSNYGQKMLSDFTAGTAMPKFSKTQLRSALIPVPPYSEQKRIIEKIKQLDVLVSAL